MRTEAAIEAKIVALEQERDNLWNEQFEDADGYDNPNFDDIYPRYNEQIDILRWVLYS